LLALLAFNGHAFLRPAQQLSSGSTNESVMLLWTAPGDDSLSGTATTFDLRMSTTWPTEQTFEQGVRISWAPAPGSPGTRQNVTVSGLAPGTTYYFAIRTRDDVGNWSRMSNVLVATPGSVAGLPQTYTLAFLPPAPNPARGATTLRLSLPEPGRVTVDAYDIVGRHVRRLVDGVQPAGMTALTWDLTNAEGRRLPAGTYFVRADLAGTVFQHRMVVVN
jgi:hypothetical protein